MIGSTNFPVALDTDAELFEAVNNCRCALSAGIAAGATDPIPVADGPGSVALFPDAGSVRIDDEILYYVGKSASYLGTTAVYRGQEGTDAASHLTGAVASMVVAAGHHNALKDALKAVESRIGAAGFALAEDLSSGDVVRIVNESGVKVRKIEALSLGTLYSGGAGDADRYGRLVEIPGTDLAVALFRVTSGSSLKAQVVRVSSSGAVSFGTAATVATGLEDRPDVFAGAWDSVHQRLFLATGDNSNGYVKAFSIGSDLSLTQTGSVQFSSSNYTRHMEIVFDPDAGAFLIAWADYGNSNRGTGRVAQITSGETITLGTALVFEQGQTENISGCHVPAMGRVFLSYSDGGNSGRATGVVGRITSGQTITFGTPAELTGDVGSGTRSAVFSRTGQILAVYSSSTGGYGITGVLGWLRPGESFSFGEPVFIVTQPILTPSLRGISVADDGRIFAGWRGSSNDRWVAVGQLGVGTVSAGESVSLGTYSQSGLSLAFVNRHLLIGIAESPGFSVCAADIDTPNAAAGILQASGTTGDVVAVALAGTRSYGHSGLTPGARYYIQPDRTIGTFETPFPIGRAVSDTELQVQF